MDIRYKKKAMIGVAVWGCAFLAELIVLIFWKSTAHSYHEPPMSNPVAIFWVTLLIIQYVMFFWGGSHLATAKGYTNAIVLPGLCPPAQLVIVLLLLFGMPDKLPQRSGKSEKRRPEEQESTIARVIRFRRNAFVFNLFGLIGILISLAVFFLPLGLFERRDSAGVAAILVFVPSYAAVIYGCYWWTRAKFWTEGVLLIGLFPLVVLFIPRIQRIFILVPLLLPASLVVMPIILLSVVAVLPDKSGMPKRKRWDRD